MRAPQTYCVTIGCMLMLFCTGASSDGSRLPDPESLTADELNALPPEVLMELPAQTVVGKFANVTDSAAMPFLLSFPLRLLGYLPVEAESEVAFANAVTAFQRDISQEQTGTLTVSQYLELSQRMTRRFENPVYASDALSVFRHDGYVAARGTWVLEDQQIAYPINTAEIICRRNEECRVTQASVSVPSLDSDADSYGLQLNSNHYQILSWGDDEVIFRVRRIDREGLCEARPERAVGVGERGYGRDRGSCR